MYAQVSTGDLELYVWTSGVTSDSHSQYAEYYGYMRDPGTVPMRWDPIVLCVLHFHVHVWYIPFPYD